MNGYTLPGRSGYSLILVPRQAATQASLFHLPGNRMSLRTRGIYIFTVELNSNLSHINEKIG